MGTQQSQVVNGMKITFDEETLDVFTVESPSGNTYTVKYVGSGDGDPDHIRVWDCNCPARVICKHIKAVIQVVTECLY